jgi:hypothetical protein
MMMGNVGLNMMMHHTMTNPNNVAMAGGGGGSGMPGTTSAFGSGSSIGPVTNNMTMSNMSHAARGGNMMGAMNNMIRGSSPTSRQNYSRNK